MDFAHLRVQAQSFSQRPLRLIRLVHFLINGAQNEFAEGRFWISPQTLLYLSEGFLIMICQQENISKIEVSLGIGMVESDNLLELVFGRGEIGLRQVGTAELIVRRIEAGCQIQ